MKKFAGFTPQQQYTLLTKQGYNGPADEASMAKFLAASPGAASKMGEYAQIAQQRLAGRPMQTQAMAEGGLVAPQNFDLFEAAYPTSFTVMPVMFDEGGVRKVKYAVRKADNPSQVYGSLTDSFEEAANFANTSNQRNNLPLVDYSTTPENVQDTRDFRIASVGNQHVLMRGNDPVPLPGFSTPQMAQEALGKLQSGVPMEELNALYRAPSKVVQQGNYWSTQTPTGIVAGQFASKEEAEKFLAAQQAGETGPFNVALGTNNQGVAQGNYSTSSVTPTGNVATTTNVGSDGGGGTAATYQGTPGPEGTISYDPTKPMEFAVPEAPTPLSATSQLMQSSIQDPMSIVQRPEVVGIPEAEGTIIPQGVGQLGSAPKASTATVGSTSTAAMPEIKPAATYQATTIGEGVPQAETVQGELSKEAQVAPETFDPNKLLQLGVEAPQIVQPTQVAGPAAREVQEGELISGSAVDMAKVNEALNIEAAQADPSKMATVQGQLEGLMQQFEGGNTPAWAAGAMRQATATLAARGLGASSMAGQAVIQATMEAAMPIAMADAQTRASFESQNLSNRQQTALFAAEQRSKFLGMEFDQNFQSRVLNAAKIADIANMNFTSEVQIALENARLTQTANLANLDVSKAKMLSDMAAMTQVDLANLNNRQQAAVQNAQNFLQMDLTNLTNQQQTAIFNTQSRVNALLSDQAAQNAAKQFNAASENQANQFFAELSSTISRFNAEQSNAIKMFNAGETNATAKFNAQIQAQRDQFNATNSLIIAQANAQWRQQIALTNTVAQNEANAEAARVANGLTKTTVDQIWQRERDIMSASLTTSEGDANRALSLLLADKEAALAKSEIKAADRAAGWQLGANLLFDYIL
jgi:hypothetical protein